MRDKYNKKTITEEPTSSTYWEYDKDLSEDPLSKYWRERIREQVAGNS